MPSDVKSQFEDLSGQVVKGAGDVSKSLDAIVGSAGRADTAYDKLSKTQESSLQISDKFQKAVDSLGKSLEGIGKSGLAASKGLEALCSSSACLDNVATSIADIASEMAGLAKDKVDIKIDDKPIEEAHKSTLKLKKNLVLMNKGLGEKAWREYFKNMKSGFEKSGDSAKYALDEINDIGKGGAVDIKSLTKAIDDVNDTLLVMKHSADDIDTTDMLDTKMLAAQLKVLKQVWKGLDDDVKKDIESSIAKNGLAKAVKELTEGHDALSLKLKNAAKSVLEEASSFKTLFSEVKKAQSITDLWTAQVLEGKRDAEDFANGLGKAGVGMTAAGAAAYYFSQKLGDLLGGFEDSAVGLAKFNINTSMMSKTLATSGTSLDNMRKQLKLTREQSSEYFKVVKDGVNVLGMAPSRIMEISKALQSTFGGDPTDRLRNYIDLLKEIPSLDADLKVTASFDRESAALFALAEKGKMETVIEMDAAGVFGGGKMEFGADKDLVNAQQKTQGTLQGIHDTMLGFYPKVGPQITAIAKTATQIVSAVGGVAAMIGAYKVFFGKGTAVAQSTLNAAQQIAANTAKMANMPNLPNQNKGGGGGIGGMGKAAKLGGVAIALEAAGLAADKLSDHFDKTGDEGARYTAKTGAALLKVGAAAASGAAIGSMVPVIGTAVGAVAGALYGLVTNFDDLRDGISGIGRVIKQMTIKSDWDQYISDAMDFSRELENLGMGMPYVSQSINSAFATLYNLKKPSQEFADALAKNRSETLKSGLSMQRIFSKLDKAIKSDIFALVDFKKKLATAKIDTLSDAGSSGASFSRAIGESSEALRKKLSMLGDEFSKVRSDIAKDATLTGEQRRQALMKLHEQEMAAVKEFVSGVTQLVDALFKSPAIIRSGLQAELGKKRVEVPMEVGALRSDDYWQSIDQRSQSVAENINATLDAMSKADMEIEKAKVEFATQEKKRINDLGKYAKTKGPEFVDNLISKGALKKTAGGGLQIDEAGIGSAAEEANRKLEKTTEAMKKLRESIDETTPAGAALALAEYDAEMKKQQSDLDIMKKKVKTAAPGTEEEKNLKQGIADTTKALAESGTKYDDTLARVTESANKALDDYGKEMKQNGQEAVLTAFDPKRHGDLMKSIGKSMGKGEFKKEDFESFMPTAEELKADPNAKKKLDELNYVFAAMEKFMEKNKKQFEKIAPAGKALTDAVDEFEVTTGLATTLDISTTAMKAGIKSQDEYNKALREMNNVIADMTRVLEVDQVQELQTQYDVLSNAASKAGSLGDPTVAVNDALSKQTDLYQQQMVELEKGLKVTADSLEANKVTVTIAREIYDKKKAALDAAQEEVELSKQAVDAGDAGAKERLKAANAGLKSAEDQAKKAEKTKTQAESSYGALRKTMTNLSKQQKDLLDAFPKIGESVSKAIEDFRKSLAGQDIQAQFDMGEALGNLQEFSDKSGDMAKQSANTMIAAAKRRYASESETIRKTMAIEKKNWEARIAQANTPAEKAQTKAMAESALAAKETALKAQQEYDYKKRVVEAAEKEAQFKNEMIDSSQAVAEAQLDLAQQMGNHFSTVVEKQKEIIGYENQKAQIADKLVDTEAEKLGMTREAFILTAKGKLLNDKAIIADINAKKKSLGMQRTLFEQMLGTAFGQARSSVGARRQRTSDVSLMGYEATRVKSASTGMYSGAGKGGVRPYWQRLAEMKGKGAKRMAPEKELAEGMKATANKTAETAKNTGDLADAGLKKGSLYTHDTTSEGYLASILYVATETAVGINDMTAALQDKSTEQSVSDNLTHTLLSDILFVNKTLTAFQMKGSDLAASLASGGKMTAQDFEFSQLEQGIERNSKLQKKATDVDAKANKKQLSSEAYRDKLTKGVSERLSKVADNTKKVETQVKEQVAVQQENKKATEEVSSASKEETKKVAEETKKVAKEMVGLKSSADMTAPADLEAQLKKAQEKQEEISKTDASKFGGEIGKSKAYDEAYKLSDIIWKKIQAIKEAKADAAMTPEEKAAHKEMMATFDKQMAVYKEGAAKTEGVADAVEEAAAEPKKVVNPELAKAYTESYRSYAKAQLASEEARKSLTVSGGDSKSSEMYANARKIEEIAYQKYELARKNLSSGELVDPATLQIADTTKKEYNLEKKGYKIQKDSFVLAKKDTKINKNEARDVAKSSKATSQLAGSKFKGNELGGGKFKGNELGGTAKGKIKTIEDTFKTMAMKGGGKGKTLGGASGAKGKGGSGAAMIDFDKPERDMSKLAKSGKEAEGTKAVTGLTKEAIASIDKMREEYGDMAVAKRGTEPVGGGVGVQTAKSQAGAGGDAAGMATTTTNVSIEGKIMVQFNNEMFKNEVAKLLPSLIKLPEVAKGIQIAAFGNQKGNT